MYVIVAFLETDLPYTSVRIMEEYQYKKLTTDMINYQRMNGSTVHGGPLRASKNLKKEQALQMKE